MSKLKLIVGLVEYDKEFICLGAHRFKYTPINYVLGCFASSNIRARKIDDDDYDDCYKIIIKSKLKKKELKEKVLAAFATDEKLSKGCVIIKIN